jgi:Transglycosylase SLT domain
VSYTKGELEALWSAANPGEGNPTVMAAIALAESSGNPSAENSIGACGLWQIHPYENGCLNPVLNAHMAGAKLRSQGLGAWETYTNGSYKQYLGGGGRRDVLSWPWESEAKPEGSGLPFGLEGESYGHKAEEKGLNPFGSNFLGLGSLTEILSFLTSKAGWERIGKVLIGLFLLLTGVLGMANINNPTTTIVGGTVGKVGGAIIK